MLLLTRLRHNISRVVVASQVHALLFYSCQYYGSNAVVHNAFKDAVTWWCYNNCRPNAILQKWDFKTCYMLQHNIASVVINFVMGVWVHTLYSVCPKYRVDRVIIVNNKVLVLIEPIQLTANIRVSWQSVVMDPF